MIDSTASTAEFVEGKNLLVENFSYTNYFPIDKILTWNFNQSSGNYLLSIFNDFYSSTEILQGNFEGDSLVMDNVTIQFGDQDESRRLTRYIYKDVSENGFQLEIFNSTDNGATWTARQRYTYFRKN